MQLISSPAQAWEEIRLQEDGRQVFTGFVYPMIGLSGLSVFIGSLLEQGWGGPQSFQYAMTRCCALAVALFGGYFLAAYLINQLRISWLKQDDDLLLVQRFAGYTLSVTFVLQIAIGLLPDFSIIAGLLQFYLVYVAWEGCRTLLRVDEKMLVSFTLVTSVLLFACPWLIQFLFNKLMVILN